MKITNKKITCQENKEFWLKNSRTSKARKTPGVVAGLGERQIETLKTKGDADIRHVTAMGNRWTQSGIREDNSTGDT